MTKTITNNVDNTSETIKHLFSGKSPIITVKTTNNEIVLKIPVANGK